MDTHRRSLYSAALKTKKSLTEWRNILVSLRSEGISKEILLAELEAFRAGLSDADEDAVLEAMDLLAGYCSTFMRID